MFILPKKVLHHINRILKRFLWSGPDLKKGGKVAWEIVTRPKEEGGLGLRRLDEWNQAMIIKYIWLLLTDKGNSPWVDWIKKQMLRGRSFWEAKIPSECSWSWRKILKLRSLAKPLFKHFIGNGQATFLWHDNWHPKGPIKDHFGMRILYDAAIPSEAKVSAIISNGQWRWPSTNTIELMELRQHMNLIPNPSQQEDKIIWTPSPNGKYTTGSAWSAIREQFTRVPWYSLVWFKKCIPRYSFILWLAIQNKLATQDRIQSYTHTTNLSCVFCRPTLETHDHLFFDCSYTQNIWSTIIAISGDPFVPQTWQQHVQYASLKWNNDIVGNLILKLSFATTIYAIWRERNARTFNNEFSPHTKIIKDIENTIRCRLLSMKIKDAVIIRQWKLV